MVEYCTDCNGEVAIPVAECPRYRAGKEGIMARKTRQITTHECDGLANAESAMYGPAVDTIELDGNGWWMNNGEYATGPIMFCPFCGVTLEAESAVPPRQNDPLLA